MNNHVHLLLTSDGAGALSRLMHTFARNYVGSSKARHRRAGALWEGRYKSCRFGLQSLHRAQSGARVDGSPAGGSSMVEL